MNAERSHVVTEAVAGAMHAKDGRRDHEPRGAGSTQKLRRARSRNLPRSLQKDTALPTPLA